VIILRHESVLICVIMRERTDLFMIKETYTVYKVSYFVQNKVNQSKQLFLVAIVFCKNIRYVF